MSELEFRFDTPESRKILMDKYGEMRNMYIGRNENDELVHISIAPKSVITRTYQHNGWIRVNFYDEDGFPCGESYSGRHG